jgi:hypothetical protein
MVAIELKELHRKGQVRHIFHHFRKRESGFIPHPLDAEGVFLMTRDVDPELGEVNLIPPRALGGNPQVVESHARPAHHTVSRINSTASLNRSH